MIIKQITVKCDICLNELEEAQWSISETRRNAKEQGWAFSRNKDICPDCRQRKPKGWDTQTWEDTRNGNAETEV